MLHKIMIVELHFKSFATGEWSLEIAVTDTTTCISRHRASDKRSSNFTVCKQNCQNMPYLGLWCFSDVSQPVSSVSLRPQNVQGVLQAYI